MNHDHENEVTYFGKTNFRNQLTKFGIKTDDRRRHVYVIGKTGMGKTTLMENFILSDIYAGHGCCYVDPHGDTAEKLIDFIPSWRINDVVYFNPADLEYPVGFNILEAVTERHKHLVASGMMAVFAKIWEGMWSSRMEYILNNTILALLDNPGQTMLGINRMMSDAEFRKRMVGNIKDPVVKQFWVKEFASWSEKYATEATAAIQNKIGQFLSAGVIRNVVAQVKSTIDIRDIMDSEKIFIINLSKGRIGEDNSRLLGGLLITKIQLAAMERVDVPEIERKDFYLYVDEFQNFAVESFASILSEARKYRLCLTMAHQYIAQLTEEVRDAVFGNVGTIMAFRVGAADAMYMETEFTPRFLPEDIINLPKFNIYLKLLIDGVTSQPFSAVTLPPIAQITNSQEKVIRIGRERYAEPRADIEKNVLEWSGLGSQSDEEMYEEAAAKKKASKDSNKPRHEYDCTRCKTLVVLPVELDRSRAIYCDDCIKIVRDERKNKKGGGGKPSTPPPKTPKISEGEFVEAKPEEPSISLKKLETKPSKEERPKYKVIPPKKKEEEPKPELPKQDDKPEEKKEEKKEEPKPEPAPTPEPKPEPEPEKKPAGEERPKYKVVLPKKKIEPGQEQVKKEEPKDRPPSQGGPQGVANSEAPKKKRKRRKKKKPPQDGDGSDTPQKPQEKKPELQPPRRPEQSEGPPPKQEDKPAEQKPAPKQEDNNRPPTPKQFQKQKTEDHVSGKLKPGQSIQFD